MIRAGSCATETRAYLGRVKPTCMLPGLLAGVLIGCGGQSGSDSDTSRSHPITAPVDYLDAVHRGQQRAIKTVDIASLTQAVQLFQASEGRFPKELEELVAKGYLARLPDPPVGHKIVYSPATGQVTMVPAK